MKEGFSGRADKLLQTEMNSKNGLSNSIKDKPFTNIYVANGMLISNK